MKVIPKYLEVLLKYLLDNEYKSGQLFQSLFDYINNKLMEILFKIRKSDFKVW